MIVEILKRHVRRASRYRATRSAVFNAIFGRAWIRNDVPATLTKLQSLWWKRVSELQAAEDLGSLRKTAYSFMRGCPPFGVAALKESIPCHQPLICPFCWARHYVLDPFIALETALFGSTAPDAKLLHPGWKLLEFTARRRLRAPRDVKALDATWIRALVRKARVLIQRERRVEVDAIRNFGGIVLHRLDLGRNRLLFQRAGLLLVRPRWTLPDQLPSDVQDGEVVVKRTMQTLEPTKKAMARSFGRIARYPVHMLDAAPEAVCWFLDEIQAPRGSGKPRVQMISRYGAARGRTVYE